MAFSPDGRLLASGADDGVRLWSIEVGSATLATPHHRRCRRRGPVPTSAAANAISPQNAARVKSWKTLDAAGELVAWSPDGKWLGAGGSKITLFDAESLEQARAFTTQLDPHELAFSPDGQNLAVLRAGATLFSTNSGAELHTLFTASTISSAVLQLVPGLLARWCDAGGGGRRYGQALRLVPVVRKRTPSSSKAPLPLPSPPMDGTSLRATGRWHLALDVASEQVVRGPLARARRAPSASFWRPAATCWLPPGYRATR